MAIGEKILNFFTGGIGEGIVNVIDQRVADKDLAAKLKQELSVLIQTQGHEAAMLAERNEMERERLFNERTKEMEGTANDLKSIPIVGAIVIFLRGAFRPIFAYFTMWLYIQYFGTGMDWTDRQEALLYATGIIVLIFYFGERAAQNVLPVLARVFAAKSGDVSG